MEKKKNLWQNHLDLSDLMILFQSGQVTPHHLAKAVISRIKTTTTILTNHAEDAELNSIMADFAKVNDVDAFDQVLERFYTWGDVDNRCWIQTYTVA